MPKSSTPNLMFSHNAAQKEMVNYLIWKENMNKLIYLIYEEI